MFTSFSHVAPVCILSANGIVSHVVLHRAATSGGTVSYEGRFEILMLSGELSDSNSLYNETGGLNVLLAGSNNWVFGGRLAGTTKQVVPPAPTTMSRGKTEAHMVRVGVMKKRGRPPKYQSSSYVPVGVPLGTITTPTIQSPAVEAAVAARGSVGDAFDCGVSVGAVGSLATIAAFGSRELTPYIIDFKAGQDISKIVGTFSRLGPACILSAHGIVTQVVLHHSETSGGTIAHEGRFDILSLSGLLSSESSGQCSETSGLRVMLAGQNGWVFGGRLAGSLIAASPVTVIVGSFISDGFPEFLVAASTRN